MHTTLNVIENIVWYSYRYPNAPNTFIQRGIAYLPPPSFYSRLTLGLLFSPTPREPYARKCPAGEQGQRSVPAAFAASR